MYQVIARKYRPQTFSELIGQEHVRTTLANAIAQGRIAHGYIFSGQRGTGKTTVARILARCLNCERGVSSEPCMQCASCRETAAGNAVDVIEIDAASNRGINEIRELRENVRYRPARDRYKVFIIDEAHQITTEAFNALLKTLEEPPDWVVFMLCTTEAHKIPTTIASRCQHFTFRSVDFGELLARMEWICGQEGIQADAETMAVLAQSGDGSVRDALSALDQAIACCGTTLQAAQVRELLGLFSLDTLGEVARALEASDSRRMLEIVQELERNGHNLQHFCRELARYFRNLLVAKVAGQSSRLISASEAEQQRLADTAGAFGEEELTRYLQLTLDLYREMHYSLQPRLHLELGVLRLVYAGRLTSIEEALAGLGSAPPPSASPPSSPPRAKGGNPTGGGLKERLLGSLEEQGLQFIADAVRVAGVDESPGEVRFTAPRECGMALRSNELKAALQQVAGRTVKITLASAGPGERPIAATTDGAGEEGDELSRRALGHPEVQRFQSMFPGSQVRTVRNLKQ